MEDFGWDEYDGGGPGELVQANWHRTARRIRVASGVAVIPRGAFQLFDDLREVDLNNVSTISAFAFFQCSSLMRVIWSTASAVEIGDCAFYECARLRAIDLSNVATIGEEAFLGCKALESVTIPPSVGEIGACAFDSCYNLAEVELCEGIHRVGVGAFRYCSSLRRINVPASVAAIVGDAFGGCSSLAEVKLNEGLQRIGKKAFEQCTSLAGINIPSSTVHVEEYAFADCHQLRHAELREGLQVIGAGAFQGCWSLERIAIPSSVAVVGRRAFGDCTSLAEVTLREGVLCIDPNAFTGCAALAHINIPPVALVVDFEHSRCQFLQATMPRPQNRTLVASKWMQFKSPSQLEEAEAKVNEILGGHDQNEDEKSNCILKWFLYYCLLDVTTMLELAIWRANMDGNEQDAEARLVSRDDCGNDMNVIIQSVLPYVNLGA